MESSFANERIFPYRSALSWDEPLPSSSPQSSSSSSSCSSWSSNWRGAACGSAAL